MGNVTHTSDSVSRRTALARFLKTGIPLVLAPAALLHAADDDPPNIEPGAPAMPALSPGDDAFLEELEKANFQYFWDQADPQTGLIKDRCNVRAQDQTVVSSIAATGFGLTALCIGMGMGAAVLWENLRHG